MDFYTNREVFHAELASGGVSVTFGPEVEYKDTKGKKITAIQVQPGQQLEVDLESQRIHIIDTKTLQHIHAKGVHFSLSSRTARQQWPAPSKALITYGYKDDTLSVESISASKVILQQGDYGLLAAIE